MKINIGVIFGGKSVEHELSVLTAIQAMDYIDKEKYDVIPIYITKDLKWYAGGMLKFIDSFKDFRLIEKYATEVNLINKNGRFILQTTKLFKHEFKELHLVIPMVHGHNIEDGTIQGYLNIVGIPYIGSDVITSAVSQDKVYVKQVLESNNMPVTKYVWLYESDYRNDKESLFKKIEELKYPLIIKPARLGSSIGIEIIKRKEELELAIEKAVKFDEKVIIEELIDEASEYNCCVIGCNEKMKTSLVEEIIKKEDICQYQDKIIIDTDEKAKIKRVYPANISKSLTEEIEKLALDTFHLLNVRGTAKVDFLYDKKKKKLYINEVNLIPSFYSHHLWEEKNIDYKELLDILIKEEINNINKQEKMTLTIDSDIFKPLKTKEIKEMK